MTEHRTTILFLFSASWYSVTEVTSLETLDGISLSPFFSFAHLLVFFFFSFLLSLVGRHILFGEIYRRPLNFCPSHQFRRLRIAEPGTILPSSFAKRLQAWSFCRYTTLSCSLSFSFSSFYLSRFPPSFAFKGSSPTRVIFQPLPAPGDR